MQETWKDIPNYEGLYQVSNLGKIKSLLFNKEKILKTRLSSTGYELINLKGKTFRVHSLVASAFIPNPSDYKEINHKNEIKNDNRVENLKVMTQDEHNKLHKEKLLKTKICIECGKEFEPPIKHRSRNILCSKEC